MLAAKWLILIGVAALVIAWITGQIHRPGMWQGGLLVILSSVSVLAVRNKAPPASGSATMGRIYVGVVAALTCVLLIARQTNPAAANWIFAATAIVIAMWMVYVVKVTRATNG